MLYYERPFPECERHGEPIIFLIGTPNHRYCELCLQESGIGEEDVKVYNGFWAELCPNCGHFKEHYPNGSYRSCDCVRSLVKRTITNNESKIKMWRRAWNSAIYWGAPFVEVKKSDR